MKFNLKMFRNVLPKKSVLKKNKWVLVILALVILVGLYWYSKKSQENYYNSRAEGPWEGKKTLKKDLAGNVLPPVRVDKLSEDEQTNLLRFATHISGIRDVFYKVQNKNSDGEGSESTDMYCSIERKKGRVGPSSIVTDINEYGTFIDLNQQDTPATSIWTGINGANQDTNTSGDCQTEYSALFTNHQTEINTELGTVQAQINQAQTDPSSEDPVYIDEIIHEQVTLYLGDTECNASNNFVTKIWTNEDYKNGEENVKGENLRQTIQNEFPGIEFDEARVRERPALVKPPSPYAPPDGMMAEDIIRCEHIVAGEEDRSATDNLEICQLAGFYTEPKDDKLGFPLIQYSFLGRTNKDRGSTDEGYTRYTVNFDPTKKLVTDGVNGKKMVDEVDEDGVKKTVYTSQKIIDWLSDLRGN